ncbi:MAG: PLP-dependent aspartate aminotransferase family protein [Thermoleophilia bacterium]
MTADRPDGALRPETRLVTGGRPPHLGAPLNVPITPASNFRASGPSVDGDAHREYSRDDATPGWDALEAVVGDLEGGTAVAFASGMAAAAAVIDLLPVGSRAVACSDAYTGTRGLLADGRDLGRWSVEFTDTTDTGAALAAMAGADLVWLESPSNPLMEIADLPALCGAARPTGSMVVVDNTFATPLLQRPLALGADVVIHSATKFLGGHSDLLLGIAVSATPELGERLRERRALAGATPGALEAFLALRGIRTLAVRLERSQATAGELARRLDAHPAVGRVRYPGLPADPGHDRAAAQMAGFGAILSFELADAATADRVCDAVRVITSATSLGGVETTIERRAKLPGSDHVPPGLLRVSVGLEHVDDLWADLTAAIG